MGPELVLILFKTFAPGIQKAIADHQAATGNLPTLEELQTRFFSDVDGYLAEGAAWKTTHPNA